MGLTEVIVAAAAKHHNVRAYAWIGWVVVALAVVVFAWIARWWIRNARRRRSP
jgi:hypothetical protein